MQPKILNAIIGVSEQFDPVILEIDEEYRETILEFGNDDWQAIPTDPGIYRCKAEFIVIPGYLEGERVPAEDDWRFYVKESTKIFDWREK